MVHPSNIKDMFFWSHGICKIYLSSLTSVVNSGKLKKCFSGDMVAVKSRYWPFRHYWEPKTLFFLLKIFFNMYLYNFELILVDLDDILLLSSVCITAANSGLAAFITIYLSLDLFCLGKRNIIQQSPAWGGQTQYRRWKVRGFQKICPT